MTQQYTDTQLKQALAKILPTIVAYDGTDLWFQRPVESARQRMTGYPIVDSELLHLCWLVEDKLIYEDKIRCAKFIYQQDEFITPSDCDGMIKYDELFNYIHATWQQRTIALAKVKGVEIV